MCEMLVMQWTWVCHTRGDCRHALGSLSLAPLPVWSYASSFCSTPGSKPAECSTCAYRHLAWPLQRSLGLQDHGVIARRPCGWVEAAAFSVVLFRRHQSRRHAGGSGARGGGGGSRLLVAGGGAPCPMAAVWIAARADAAWGASSAVSAGAVVRAAEWRVPRPSAGASSMRHGSSSFDDWRGAGGSFPSVFPCMWSWPWQK